MSNKKKMDGIKKGLIVSLIGAVVLMSVLLGTVNVRATTSASLYGSVSSYAPQWINASSDGACVLQLKVTLAGATGGIDSVNVTFNNVTGNFNATTDFMPLVNNTNSGVMLYYDTNGNGFQSTDTPLFFDSFSWTGVTSGGVGLYRENQSYQANFSSPTGIETTGDKYIYVVVKTNTTAYDGAKFNVSVNASNIIGNDGTVTPTSDLFSDFTTTIDAAVPNALTSVSVNNYTACSNWTSDPYFIINWTSGGDSGSGVSDVYYKLDTAPTTYNDGTSCTTNYTLDIRTINSTAGNHTLYLWAVDYAHNPSANSILYLRYDTTAPTLNSIIISDTSSGNTTWSDSSSVTLTLSATDSASGMGTGAKMSFSNDGTTWSANETYAITKTWTLASGVDGIRTVYFRAKDVAGNENTTGLSDAIILDTTAPSVVNNGTTYNNSYGFATYNDTITLWANITDDPLSIGSSNVSGILFNATAGSWYVMLNVTLLNDTLPIGWVEMKNKTGDPTNFTYTMEVNWTTIRWNQSDGDKWLQVNATDNSSHANTSKYILVKVDTSAPVVTNNPTVYPTFTDALGCTVNQTNATNGNTVTFNVTIWDSGSLQYKMINVTNITTDSYTGVSGWPVWLNPPGYVGRWVNLTQGAYINSTTYYYTANVTIGNASNGTIYLQVNATDYLNNSNIVKNVNLTIDNIIPNVTMNPVNYNASLMPWVPGDGSGIAGVYHNVTTTWAANGENVTLNVSVGDNATGWSNSNISLVQVNVAALNSSQTWVNMTLQDIGWPSGNWTVNVTLYGATNGTKALQVKAWDNASNLNDTTYIYVNVDNPPVVTANATGYLNYTWQNCAQNGTIINISVTVTDDDIAGVKVFLNDTKFSDDSTKNENLTYLGGVWAVLTQISGTNTWYNNTINVSATADGTYNLTINATDKMGNWNNTQNVTVKVDNQAPSVSVYNQAPWGVVYITNYGNNNWSANGTKITINVTVADIGVAGIYKLWVNVTNITDRATYPQGWLEMTNKSNVAGTANNWTLENITVSAVTGNWTIWFNATDNASNYNLTEYTTVNIDNIAPNVTFAGYYNATGVVALFCTNITAANGSANFSVANNDSINLTVHVNDSLSNMLFNATSQSFYITVNATPINASLGWVEMNSTSAQPWNFTINITIGNTIRDGNYTLFFNITDNATNRNTTTSYPCNITIWVKGLAPLITSTSAYYPDESPTKIYAAIPGHNITINATVFDGSGCNVSWTNAVWVDVGLITTGSAGNWVAMNNTGDSGTEWAGTEPSLIFHVNVTVGSAIASGTYNLTVYGVDIGGRSTNNTTSAGRMWWVNVSVDRDNPLVTNPSTIYQNGTSANSTANGGLGEWVNISVNIVDIPAGVYNVTVYVGEVNNTLNGFTLTGEPIINGWANMSRNGTSDVYWAKITVNNTAAGDGAHYLQVKVQDNVGHWYNDTYIIILIQTMGPSVTVTVTLLPGSLASLGTNSTGIIGNDVSVKATTSTDVVNVSVDLSAFFNAAGYSLGNGSNVNMSYSANGVWYYNFTLYASESAYVNNNTVCSFNATAYRSGYTGWNNTTAKIDAVRPNATINQTMSQWWNNTLFNTYSGCIFLNWTHSEAGWWDATFKIYYKTSTSAWSEWSLSNTSAMCANFTSITEGETYYFYVVATDYAGNVEASRYISGSIVEAYNLTTGDVSTTVDTAFPSSYSIIINNGDLFNTTGTANNLTISGYDITSGLGAVSFSNDGLAWSAWYDFVSPVCTDAGNQQYAAIYGDIIVWYNATATDLYAYNLANKTQWRITSGSPDTWKPGIYGDYIVYADTNVIYAYNIATGVTTAIYSGGTTNQYPAISGTIVVWQGDSNIYKYDISNPGAGITQLTTSGQANYPAIYGNYVVWEDNRNSGTTGLDIYMYDLGGIIAESAVCTASGAQRYPQIHGNYIVWQDLRSVSNDDIYMYNIGTSATTAVCTDTAEQMAPAIYGDYIVWNDTRYDSSGDIFMYTISTGKETQVTGDTDVQNGSAVYGNYIVWHDYRNGNYDIYMQQIGNSKTMINGTWALNGTEGTCTVYMRIRDWANNTVVNITDTIIYDPTAPAGLTIVINYNATLGTGDNITTNRTIRLNLTAYDPTSNTWDNVISDITPGYYLIQFRNKTTGTWGAWSDWILWSGNSSTAGYYYYTLSPGDGDRIVEFRIKDRAGNIANPVSDSILLNTGVPTVTYTIVGTIWGISGNDADGNPWYNNTPVRVNISATDAQNISILWYMVTFDNGTTTGWKNCTSYHTYNWINISGYSGGAAGVYDDNLSFTKEGVHIIEYYALNNLAGTNATGTLYIRIDKTKSNITLSPDGTAGNMNCFNTTLTITIGLTDTSSEDPLNATPSGVNWTRFRVWKEGAVGTFSCGYYNATGVWISFGQIIPSNNQWVNYSGTGLTNLTLLRLLEEGNYTIEVNTTDYAGNSNVTNVTYVNLTYIRIDMTNPIPGFTVNGLQGLQNNVTVSSVYYTNSTYVVLRLDACDYRLDPTADANVSGPWRFQVSNDGVNWYGYNATNVWTLNEYVNWTINATGSLQSYNWYLSNESQGVPGNYNRTVWFKMFDNASNYVITSKWIILDTHLPTSTVTVSPGIAYDDATVMNTTIFNVTWSGSDVYDSLNGSGINQFIVQYNYSDDGGVTWTGWIWNNTVGASGTSQFTGVDGRVYYFRCNATDRLIWRGNYSTLVKVIVDTTVPTSSADAITTYWHNTGITITATADDVLTGKASSGVLSVDLLYKYCSDNSTWPTGWTLFGTDTASPWSWDFTFSSDGYYKFCTRAKDKGYNVETALPADYDTIAGYDTVKPTTGTPTLTGTLGENSWYTTEVTVTLAATDPSPSSGGLTIEYYVDTGAWITYTAAFTITTDGIHTVYYRTTDTAGNVESTGTKEVKVDKTAPTATSIVINSGDAYTNTESVLLTVSASDATSTVYKMSFKNEVTGTWSDWLDYAAGPTAWSILTGDDGLRTVYFKVKDYAGLESYVTSDTITLDKTAPTTTDNAPAGWQNADIIVTLTPTDATSGVGHTYYKVWLMGTTEPTSYTEGTTVTISTDGKWYVKYYSVDTAGNSETPNTVEAWLDTTAPTTTDNAPTEEWQTTTVTVTLTATDANSGVANTYYKKWLITGTEPGSYTAGTVVTISTDGKWYVKYYSVDTATNEETPTTKEVWRDTTPPTTTDDAPSGWQTTSPVVVTLTVTDATSGAAATYYKKWLTTATEPTTGYTAGTTVSISDDGKWYVKYYSVDTAGKEETAHTVEVWLDTTAPTTTDNAPSPLGWQTTTVTVTLTATDANSGVANTYYKKWLITGTEPGSYTAGTVVTISTDGKWYVKYYSVDTATKAETAHTVEIWLDTTAPTTTDDALAGWQTTSPVVVTLTATDATSGVAYTYYKKWLSTSTEPTSYTAGATVTISDDGKSYIKYYSVDTAGKAETPTTKEVWIDTADPTITASLSGTEGENDYYTSKVTVTLTASDATSGVATREYIHTGDTWVEYTVPFEITADGTYTLQYRATDSAGNTKDGTAITVKIDKTAPTALSISIAAGADYTKSASVTLTLDATGETLMLVSNDQVTWLEYNASWTLSTGDGTKTVYFKAVDDAGNYAISSDTIILDTTAPTAIASANKYTIYKGETVSFSGEGSSDATSGIATYKWVVDGVTEYTTATPSHKYTKTDTYTVTLTVTDNAGNSATDSIEITVKEKPEPSIPGFEVLALIAAIGVAVVLLRKKH